MNWLGFFASTIGSLAWPVTVIILVLILKDPISKLLPLLRKAKYKDLELDFAERAQEAREVVLTELPQTEPRALPEPPQPPTLMPEQSPRTMVLEAWLQVEAAATAAAQRLGGVDFTDTRRLSSAIRFLESSDQVDRRAIGLLRDLRGLRNEAVHVPDFQIPDVAAIDYGLAAARLTDYFNSIARGV